MGLISNFDDLSEMSNLFLIYLIVLNYFLITPSVNITGSSNKSVHITQEQLLLPSSPTIRFESIPISRKYLDFLFGQNSLTNIRYLILLFLYISMINFGNVLKRKLTFFTMKLVNNKKTLYIILTLILCFYKKYTFFY